MGSHGTWFQGWIWAGMSPGWLTEEAVIIDFGTSFFCDIDPPSDTVFGPSIVPDLFFGGRASFKSDIWSLGGVVFEMWASGHPFGGADDSDRADDGIISDMVDTLGQLPELGQVADWPGRKVCGMKAGSVLVRLREICLLSCLIRLNRLAKVMRRVQESLRLKMISQE